MLVDGVVVINEVNGLAKKTRKLWIIFKLDIEKTYDFVSWKFLDYMLVRFRFNDK